MSQNKDQTYNPFRGQRYGTSQDTRLNQALLPSFVKIDERNLDDLLVYLVDYAYQVNYFNPDNVLAGTWEDFFFKDHTVVLAMITKIDVQAIDNERIRIIDGIKKAKSPAKKVDAFEEYFDLIILMGEMFDFWYTNLAFTEDALTSASTGLEMELANSIQFKLSRNLKKLMAYDYGAEMQSGVGRIMGRDYSNFSPIWMLDDQIEPINIFKPKEKDKDRPLVKRINDAIGKVNLIYRVFFNTLTYLVNIAPNYFNKSLEDKSDHPPDMALMLAFLKLFGHLQHHMNSLTERHLEYYYKKVLALDVRHPVPDKIYVYFDPADHVETYLLKKGIQLMAEKTLEGITPLYEIDDDLLLTKTKIESLKTLFVSRNLNVVVGSTYRLVSNIYAAPIADSKDGLGAPFIKGKNQWPTFGEDQLNKIEEEQNMIPAETGFVISSPMLFLEGGERQIDLSIVFEEASMRIFRMLLVDICENNLIRWQDVFSKVFRNCFIIQLSGEEGWINVDRYDVQPSEKITGKEIKLGFNLSASDPSVVPPNAELLGIPFESKYPVLKITLNPEDASFVYSFIREFVVESVSIDVRVEKLKTLDVYNQQGKLDESLPFYPFGPMPTTEAYLAIGHPEVFKKYITDLSFQIEWMNLPKENCGFKDHYRLYRQGWENDSFKVSLSALNDHRFHPSDPRDVIKYDLFESIPSDNERRFKKVAPVTNIENIPLSRLKLLPDFDLKRVLNFDNYTPSGFFKLELTDPPEAFGHELYNELFTEAVTEKANAASKSLFSLIRGGNGTKAQTEEATEEKTKKQKLPKEPYVPTIKALSLSYTATTTIYLSPTDSRERTNSVPEQYYHIHPFGHEICFDKGKILRNEFLPQFDEDGYLFIGLKDLVAPEPLSLYFEMTGSPQGHTFYYQPDIFWSYLSENEWRPFTSSLFLSDGTKGFTTSGIITLEIPEDISDDNTILPEGLFWIRVSVKGNVNVLSHTRLVTTQAVSATWMVDKNDPDHLDELLPPYSITGLTNDLPEVSDVVQPFPSFGGRPIESTQAFYNRVSERLRHKGRALTQWDAERIVLDNFPNVAQVKCLSHLTHPDVIEKGKILVVVIPKVNKYENPREPKVNYNTLTAIKKLLEEKISTFADLEVRNPSYEWIKVTCNVLFKEEKNKGLKLKQLNKEINEFLSPWLFGNTTTLDMGGSISKSLLLSFIEQRPYVDFVTSFSGVQVFVNEEGEYWVRDTATDDESSDMILASKPWSILIPFEKHAISFLDEEAYQPPVLSSIGSMGVEIDFVITGEQVDREGELLLETLEIKQRKMEMAGLIKKQEEPEIYDLDIDIDNLKE
ncbi:MAG: hypothetical protein AAF502_23405 [Bacteroidota bacterium]